MRQKLLDLVHHVGLGHVAPKLHSLARNTIGLKTAGTKDSRIEIGHSKLGGRPDLPRWIMWPSWNGRPLDFIAQFRLSDLARHDSERALPRRGMLYFFYDAQEQPWGQSPDDRGAWRILFYEGKETLKRTSQRSSFFLQPRPPHDGKPLPTCSFTFSREITLPDPESLYIERLSLSKKERDAYYELLKELDQYFERGDHIVHRLLGYPDPRQGEMQRHCQLVSNGYDSTCSLDPERDKWFQKSKLGEGMTDWRLLLQLDSDPWIWGDAGRIYFWIRQQDLQTCSLGNAWLALQC